jgi:hypothetical protein
MFRSQRRLGHAFPASGMIRMGVLPRLKRSLGHLRRRLQLELSDVLWLPLGENCSADVILTRHKLRSFATFFSDAWSTIDHVLELDRIGYEQCFDRENLDYNPTGKTFVFSKIISNQCEIFNLPNGPHLAFPHADLIKCPIAREKMRDRIRRFQRYRHRKNLVFFYYHIKGPRTSLEQLFAKLNQFAMQFRSRYRYCKLVVFTHSLVEDPQNRRLKFNQIDKDTLYFEINTLERLDGQFYAAEHDDDLVAEMVRIVKLQINRKNPFGSTAKE